MSLSPTVKKARREFDNQMNELERRLDRRENPPPPIAAGTDNVVDEIVQLRLELASRAVKSPKTMPASTDEHIDVSKNVFASRPHTKDATRKKSTNVADLDRFETRTVSQEGQPTYVGPRASHSSIATEVTIVGTVLAQGGNIIYRRHLEHLLHAAEDEAIESPNQRSTRLLIDLLQVIISEYEEYVHLSTFVEMLDAVCKEGEIQNLRLLTRLSFEAVKHREQGMSNNMRSSVALHEPTIATIGTADGAHILRINDETQVLSYQKLDSLGKISGAMAAKIVKLRNVVSLNVSGSKITCTVVRKKMDTADREDNGMGESRLVLGFANAAVATVFARQLCAAMSRTVTEIDVSEVLGNEDCEEDEPSSYPGLGLQYLDIAIHEEEKMVNEGEIKESPGACAPHDET